jgi:Tfp pilus assembly protein FimT
MVVVGIIGLIMTAGIPSLYQLMRRDGYQKGVSDLLDVCNNARARAVLQDTTTAIVFHPHERRCDLEGGAKASIISTAGGTGLTAQFPDTVSLEMLDVNLREYKDAEIARVRFFPNGTSDEMTVIVRGDNNEWRKISLEITTGMVSVTDKIQ